MCENDPNRRLYGRARSPRTREILAELAARYRPTRTPEPRGLRPTLIAIDEIHRIPFDLDGLPAMLDALERRA